MRGRPRTIQMCDRDIYIPFKSAINGLFTDLRKNKIIARKDFLCCGNCGASQIGVENEGKAARPFVFYHHQDTTTLHEHGLLYLSYGFTEDVGEESVEELGRKIKELAEKRDLMVEWNGKSSQKILLTTKEIFEFKKVEEEKRRERMRALEVRHAKWRAEEKAERELQQMLRAPFPSDPNAPVLTEV